MNKKSMKIDIIQNGKGEKIIRISNLDSKGLPYVVYDKISHIEIINNETKIKVAL
jgi:hypothetical protein